LFKHFIHLAPKSGANASFSTCLPWQTATVKTNPTSIVFRRPKASLNYRNNLLIFNMLRHCIFFVRFPSASTIKMPETTFVNADIFKQTDAKFRGQHINSCSRVIHTSFPANKIKLSSGFAGCVQTACSPVSPVRIRKAFSTA
jgi:hypothetical protein